MSDWLQQLLGTQANSTTSVGLWYGKHKDKCPNCGINLSIMPPEANLYPHYTGACKDASRAPKE